MGYHQVKISKESTHLTAFITPHGHYEYLRVPFGLANAPMMFQRVMREIINMPKFTRVFLDDILVFSSSIEEHTKHLSIVLQKLKENNIAINVEKSNLYSNEVKYLGVKLNSEGMRPDTSRIKEIEEYKMPKNRKQTQKLLGYINWFRPFLQNLSIRICPITEKLQKKHKDFVWTDDDTKTVTRIFFEIKETTLLCYPDTTKEFILETDASENGMGAVLKQHRKLIGLFSRKFTSPQTRYTVTEKEFLAVITALEYFKNIIFGSKITIITDHANLINNVVPFSSRTQMWKILFEQYNYKLVYRKGEENTAADYLSRVFLLQTVTNIKQKKIIPVVNVKMLKK